jgi:hypothetical protein
MAQFDSPSAQEGVHSSHKTPETIPKEIAQVIPRQLFESLTPLQLQETKGKTVGFKLTWPEMLQEEESTTDPEIWQITNQIGGSHIAFAVADFDNAENLIGYDIIHLFAAWIETGIQNGDGEEVYTVVGAPLEARLNNVNPERVFKKVEPIGIIDRRRYPTNGDLMNLSELYIKAKGLWLMYVIDKKYTDGYFYCPRVRDCVAHTDYMLKNTILKRFDDML